MTLSMKAVFLRGRSTEVEVTIDVLQDLILGLAGRVGEDVGEDFLEVI